MYLALTGPDWLLACLALTGYWPDWPDWLLACLALTGYWPDRLLAWHDTGWYPWLVLSGSQWYPSGTQATGHRSYSTSEHLNGFLSG